MKTIHTLTLVAAMAAALPARPAQTPDAAPPPSSPAEQAPATPGGSQPPAATAPATPTREADAADPTAAPAGGATDAGKPAAALAPEVAPPAPPPTPPPTDGLRLNFRNAPLELVLNYLSEAAGFVIVLEAEVKGKVDVWSNQPVTKDEAVALLNSVLNRNGYAAIRNERTLTIVSRDEAKKRDIPVRTGGKAQDIPKNDEMVTQIIPVRYANAVQMVKDLQPLLPTYANLTANESGNALVLTDTQADIRRMVEIVTALDTSISGISRIHVFPLRFADAKELASAIKELFPTQTGNNTGRGGNQNQQFFGPFGGFGRGQGGGGGGGAGAAAQAGQGQSEARQAASRVTAVADERTNSLIVSAPEELLPTIQELVEQVDKNAENVTELRVFHLSSADPSEMADILSNLFPDDSKTDNTRGSVQFGRGGPGGGPGGGFAAALAAQSASSGASNRLKQKGRVLAVPDLRTSSVIVSAARDLMPQIAEMITQLDANPARKQKVFVYSLENADVQEVQQVLEDMFERNTTSRSSRNTANQNSALTTRSTRNQNTTSGTTSSGFGGSGQGASRNSSGAGF